MTSKQPKRLTEADLDRLQQQVSYFEERKARAAERLSAVTRFNWYFALLGLKTSLETFEFDKLATLQEVIEPPGEVELASALENKSIFGALGRYSHNIQWELSVNREFSPSDQAAFNLAWWIIAALRVKTSAELLIPAVADYSWSTIAALSDSVCHAQLIEDIPKAKRLGDAIEVTESDLQWVGSHLPKFVELLEVPKFRLAVESLSTHHFANSDRMMAATLWAGIEALFAISTELRFRLAILAACVLEPRGSARRDVFQRVKKLYDVRSKAVHGSPLTSDKMHEHIVEVKTLLSRLLCRFTEMGRIPDEGELEDFIFM